MELFTNLDLSVYNGTNDNIEAKIEEVFSYPLLGKQSDYSLSITRFSCPITSTEKMKIDAENASLFTIQIGGHLNVSGTDEDTNSVNEDMLFRNVIPIYSPKDFVENVNRTLCKANRSLVTNNATWNATFLDEVTNAGVTFNTGVSESVNMVVALAGSTETYDVQLTLSGFTDNGSTNSTLCDIILENPTGIQSRVASGVLLSNLTNGNSVTFTECGSLDQSSVDKLFNTRSNYQPIDSFLKFKDATANGTWVVHVQASGANTLNIDLDVVLTVITPPKVTGKYELWNVPPNVSLNTSTGFFTLNLHERFVQRNFKITCGKFLQRILNIQGTGRGSEYLQYPYTELSETVDDVQSFTAETPKMYLLNAIDKILVFSNSLNIQKDYKNNVSTSFAVTSFDLPSSQIMNFDYVHFAYGGSIHPFRTYPFTSSEGLRRFDISFKVLYRDGTEESIFIEPGQNASMLISLFKR